MSGLDRRFGPSQREDPIDRPGLVIDDANNTYVITPDGVRHLLDGSIDPSSLTLDTIGAGTDVVTNNASLSQHGLLRKLDNNILHFLNGAGGWTIPAAGGIQPSLGWHNVLDYGAVGDGVANDGPAIQAAFDAAHAEAVALGVNAGNPVYFPAGIYKWNATLIWKAHPIIGVSEDAVHCFWGGGTGTGPAISGVTYSQGQRMEGIQFRGGSPNIWVEKGNVDVWDTMNRVFFSSVTVAALKCATLINWHMTNMRWNLGEGGFGIWINHGNSGGRNFSLSDFTISEAGPGVGTVPGFIKYGSTGGGITAGIRNARIEFIEDVWAANGGFVVLTGTPSVVPIILNMSNLDCEMGTQTNPPAVLHKTAGLDTAALPVMMADAACNFGGFANWMTGSYTYGGPSWTPPALPSGKGVHLWETGREGSGGGPLVLLEHLKVGVAGSDRQCIREGATSVADGGTIAHGIHSTGVSHTPIAVYCTPSVAGEFVSVTAIGATTFTVAIRKHDGTAGTTQTVYWRAII